MSDIQRNIPAIINKDPEFKIKQLEITIRERNSYLKSLELRLEDIKTIEVSKVSL